MLLNHRIYAVDKHVYEFFYKLIHRHHDGLRFAGLYEVNLMACFLGMSFAAFFMKMFATLVAGKCATNANATAAIDALMFGVRIAFLLLPAIFTSGNGIDGCAKQALGEDFER